MDRTGMSNRDRAAREVRSRVRFPGLGWWCLTILLSGCSDDVVGPHQVEVFSTTEIDRSTSKILTLGIVPQQSPADIERNWGGLAEYLTQKMGKEVLIKTASSIPEFERRCADGVYDLSYMNPYHYTVFARNPGYRAIAKQKDKRIVGILVVRKDNQHQPDDYPPTEVLRPFAGQEAAFPSPAAFAASLLTRAEFEKENVSIRPVYVRTHDSVYEGVVNGNFRIGGGVMRTLNSMDEETRDQLRIYWKSRRHTPHALAAHPRVTDDDFQQLQAALTSPELNGPSSEWKQTVLQPIRFNGFVQAEDSDWDDVRALNLTELEVKAQ